MTREAPAWRRRAVTIALLACIGTAAAWLLLAATPDGLGLGGDSYYYVSGARSLLDGQGFARPAADGSFRPITHFPPFYSLVLAAAGGIGWELPPAARALHAVLFGINTVLVGWLVWRATRSSWLAGAGALLFASSPSILGVHSWLLSEALFLCLMLVSVNCLVSFLERGRRIALIGAGAAAGLVVVTRYAGLALVLSEALVLLSWPKGSRRRSWVDLGLYLALSLAGWLAWAGRNAMLVGSVTNRGLSLHLPAASKLIEAVTTAAHWLLPGRVPVPVGAAVACALAVWLLVGALERLRSRRDSDPDGADAVLRILLAFLLVYPLLILFSLSLLDASTPLDDRILSPLYVSGIIGLLSLSARRGLTQGVRKWLMAVALGGLLALTLVRGVARASQLRQDGQGYASQAWRTSQVVEWVANLDPGVLAYSNEMDALYLLTGRQAYQVPIRWDPVRAAPREDYTEQLATMHARMQRGEAVLVVFSTLASQQAFLPPEAELADDFPAILQAPDGVVYGLWP